MAGSDNAKPLTILSVAYPLLPVSPASSGGAEQILSLLERGLKRTGLRSIVIAAEGSVVEGTLIPTPAAPDEITDEVRRDAQNIHSRQIDAALERHEIDLIHFHGLDFETYRPVQHRVPQLATLHLPLAWYSNKLFEKQDIHLNCVSFSQSQSAPSERTIAIVTNGVEVKQFKLSAQRQDYLLWLGRICPEKGVDVALRVAHRLNRRLLIAGPVHPFRFHQSYFRNQIEPLLDDKRRYLGPVDAIEKRELLSNARCLLVPSLVAETSSLVAMEAISSGTPVVAFRSGALPEVIDSGVTGFIVDSEDEMAIAISQTHEISSAVCRAVAESRFQSSRMIASYIDLYRQICAGLLPPLDGQPQLRDLPGAPV